MALGSTGWAAACSMAAGLGSVSTMAATSSSSSAIWLSFSADLRVRPCSSIVVFFSRPSSSRIRPPEVGAQLPFSTMAMVRFCRLWATMSCSAFSMFTKMPAL